MADKETEQLAQHALRVPKEMLDDIDLLVAAITPRTSRNSYFEHMIQQHLNAKAEELVMLKKKKKK